jgi:serine protease Do
MYLVKRSLTIGAKILFVVFLGGVGAVVADNYVVPKLTASPRFSQYTFLKKAAENTTIINKTEQVIIREDDSVEKIASQAASAVVNVISVEDRDRSLPKAATPLTTLNVLNGSGVLVTNDGLIVTYRKAILEKNARYTVLLYNGLNYPAELVAIDNLTNLAYLRIQASNVPAIAFANSDDMAPGKKLIALANSSEEYQNRFSTALLSNINKTFNLSETSVASSEKWEGVFEMDFPNQQDYLGGPVINFNGEMAGLVGVSETDRQKRYFLLPANVVKRSLELAIRGELAKRPMLGVYYLSITKELNFASNIQRDRGALVYAPSGRSALAVIAGSPAEKAGLQVNDIIIAVEGQEINLANPLPAVLNRFSKGDKIELLVVRNGEERKILTQL